MWWLFWVVVVWFVLNALFAILALRGRTIRE